MLFRKFVRRFQFEYLLDVLKETFARFPLPVVCAGAAALLCILETHHIKPLSDNNLPRALLFLFYGLVFFTASRLYAEGAKAPRGREVAMASAGGAALLAVAVLPDHITATHAFIGAALALSMLFAPYIGRRSTEDSVWFYNYANGMSLAVSGLSAFVLCVGLCAIAGSMDYLLYDMKLSGKIYGDIWIFGGLFFGPLMFLRQIPRRFDFEKGECVMLPGVRFIANYLVVPLILIYVWVLYVYFLKIAVQWELPKGNLACMVTGFGSIGVAARLAVFPMRDNGTKLLQQFYKYFYRLLIVPVFLLAMGLYTRLSQYGVTEERYAVGICLAWLFTLTVWHIAKPGRAHIKHVPMVLAVLFLAGALGPWGAVSVSTRSQQARLEGLLIKAGVAHADGAVTKTAQEVPFELRRDISGILDYMSDGKEKAVDRWVAPFRKEIGKPYNAHIHKNGNRESYDMPRRVMEVWGMKYVTRWENADNERISINAPGNDWNNESLQKVAPYAYMLRFSADIPTDRTIEHAYNKNGQEKLKIKLALTPAGDMTLTLSDGRKAVFAIRPLADSLFRDKVQAVPEDALDKMILRQESNGLRAELRISAMRGRVVQGAFRLEELTAILLFSSAGTDPQP
ncbi:MAG: DUF4153 domain-containing protein [Pseudomonadota bacterium]